MSHRPNPFTAWLCLRRPFNITVVIALFSVSDLIVVIASVVVLLIGSNGQVFATSAIRYRSFLRRVVVFLYSVQGRTKK